MKKIGYWLGRVTLDSGGTAPYAWRVLENLLVAHKEKEIELKILCYSDAKKDCLKLINKYQITIDICLIPEKFNLISRIVSRLADIFYQELSRQGIRSVKNKVFNCWFRWFSSLHIDILHSPYPTPPSYLLPCPYIITMHDVQELHYPEFFSPEERAWRAKYYWKALKESSATVVSFNHVKKDLIKYFPRDNEHIYVCPLPFKKIRFQEPSVKESSIYQEKYDCWGDFLLYPAQTWQHKNHISLIHALEKVNSTIGRNIHLVCTGKLNKKFFPEIEKYLNSANISKYVHFMGIVPETELCWLYRHCSLVVIPTLYEAGSFPLVEAMRLEAPVICSAITSLPETIGDSRFTFNPNNIDEISKLIVDFWGNPALRKANIENSRIRIEALDCVDSKCHFLNLYSRILDAS